MSRCSSFLGSAILVVFLAVASAQEVTAAAPSPRTGFAGFEMKAAGLLPPTSWRPRPPIPPIPPIPPEPPCPPPRPWPRPWPPVPVPC